MDQLPATRLIGLNKKLEFTQEIRMIPDSLKVQLINVIANNFDSEEIDTMGKKLEPKFNAHLISGLPFGLMIKPEDAARTLVNHFHSKGSLDHILLMLIHMAVNEDTTILGRRKEIENFDSFLQKMTASGLKYNPVQGSIETVEPGERHDTWGVMKEGEVYHFSFLSIDIAGNSEIQLKYPRGEIETVYNNLYQLIQDTVSDYQGKIWNWAGDGGIAAFYMDDKVTDSVKCAMEIQLRMVQFNLDRSRNRFQEPIRLRIAAHDGLTVYKENKGTILSDAINYVAHLEKKGTGSDHLSISDSIYKNINPRLQRIFQDRGEFEGQKHYTVYLSFEWMNFQD